MGKKPQYPRSDILKNCKSSVLRTFVGFNPKISDKLIRVLRDKKTVVTKAFFWKIPHDSGRIDIRLKVGRYKKPRVPFDPEVIESSDPKSEITFDEEEFDSLITFLQE